MLKPQKKTVFILLISLYAMAITPLAYSEAKRIARAELLEWAEKQPDLKIGGGYTKEDRDALAKKVRGVPALK